MREIAFLLGAGASIEAGMPGSATLLRRFYREPRLKLLETHYWADAKEHIDVKKTLKSLHEMLSRRVKKSQINLETIFFALAELTARPSGLIGTFVKKWHPMVEKVNWGVLTDHLHDVLNSFLIKELAIAKDTTYLGEIAEFAQHSPDRILALALQLDILAFGDCVRVAIGLAGEHGCCGHLFHIHLLGGQGIEPKILLGNIIGILESP